MPGAPVTQGGPFTVGVTATATAIFARPNDATQYTAGDVVSSSTTAAYPMVFPIARAPGIGGVIQSAVFIDSVAAATKPDLELYLFDRPVPMQQDNVAWNPTDTDVQNLVGVIAFPTGSFRTMGANGTITATFLGMAFSCLPNDQNLYGILVVRNAYTPTALEVLEIRLQALLD